MKIRSSIFLIAFVLLYSTTTAQNSTWKYQKGGNWYFSWGYGKFWYPETDIHIKKDFTEANQVVDHTEYTLKDVKAHDRLGIEKLYNVPLTVPQFCIRIGHSFNEKQDLAIELTYDHAKFITADNQYVHMVGNTNGVAFDSTAFLYPETAPGTQPFVFKLNNGANFFELNLVKKFHLYDSPNKKIQLSYHVKCGGGWNTPHVENTVFGVKNNKRFIPVGGWNVGAEGAVRCVFYDHVYLEFGQKGVFASYYHLPVASGEANLHFATYEVVFSLGVNIPSKMNKEMSTNENQ